MNFKIPFMKYRKIAAIASLILFAVPHFLSTTFNIICFTLSRYSLRVEKKLMVAKQG